MESVPFIDLKAQFKDIRGAVLDAVHAVFEEQAFILGPVVSRFEAALAESMGLPASGVIAVSSGTDALLVAMMALDVGVGDRVLTSPFSFFATAGTVARLGAIPEFVDIEPDSFNIDPLLLAKLDPRRFKAVIPVHLFGRLADMAAIRAFAGAADIPVIEDACQAIGARDTAGRAAGVLGTAGCFSFFPTKNLGGAGDGGCVTTADPALAEAIRVLRTHGAAKTYENTHIGGNFRLDALQAAVLAAKLPYLDAWTATRLENARTYDRLFRERGLAATLKLPELDQGGFIAHQYVIRAPRRDALKTWLDQRKIGSAIYYPQPFHLMEAFAYLGHRRGDFPEAERAAGEVLALPIFPELGQDRLRRVVEAVAEFYSAR